jgi:hypothetical protein
MCPLYTLGRDSGFLKGVTKEIVQKIISMEVAVFKLNILETTTNIYGESSSKKFYEPVRVFSVIRPGTKEAQDDDSTMSFSKTFTFSFIKSELKEKGLTIDEGDFIWYDDKYFEVDKVSGSNYWSGRNPNTAIGTTENDWSLYGYDYAIVADAHLTTEPAFITREGSTNILKEN